MLAGLVALCLLLRAVMAWRVPGVCPDAVLYIILGKIMEVGHFHVLDLGQVRFNIFPLILSCLHRLGFSWETAGVAWGVAISSCTVVPLVGWTCRVFGRRVAIATGILYSIHAGLIRWSPEVIRDSTFWFLFTLGLYLLWRAVSELRWTWCMAAGATIALACLTRFEGLVLLAPLAGWSWRRASQDPAARSRLTLAGLACAGVYPLVLLGINAFWFHGRTADLVRTKPMELAQDWARETMNDRPVEKQTRFDLLPPLPLGRMLPRFISGAFKGITPLYLVMIAIGIAGAFLSAETLVRWSLPLWRSWQRSGSIFIGRTRPVRGTSFRS